MTLLYDAIRLYVTKEAYLFDPIIEEKGKRKEEEYPVEVRNERQRLKKEGEWGENPSQREDLSVEKNLSKEKRMLKIDRKTGEMEWMMRNELDYGKIQVDTVMIIYGLVGIIRLHSGPYLIIITGKERISHAIWKITQTQVLALTLDYSMLTLGQQKDEQMYLKFMKRFLSQNDFHFSYTYELTHTLQRIGRMSPETKKNPLWQRADERFFWNRFAMKTMIQLTLSGKMDLSPYILPIMHAFIKSTPAEISGKIFDFILISRRNCQRAGTRFHSRGIDEKGNVSNNVETEQIIYYDGYLISFVQTRGSIPLFWKQSINLKYSPLKELENNPLAEQAFKLHFDDQFALYGDQIVVNLVDRKGSELALANQYSDMIQQKMKDKNLRYVHFDFHHECRRMQWHNLSKLVTQIEKELDMQGYFFMDPASKVRKQQSSVVRTNCVDCLDRTNVVQSLLAHRSLVYQLRELGILREREVLEEYPDFSIIFRNTWADNGDMLSFHYSGTGALKSDYTRTGKRTPLGVLKDGCYSALRYIKNNFLDGARQDSIDLFLGNYEVRSDLISPFATVERSLKLKILPAMLFMGTIMFLHGLLTASKNSTLRLFFMIFWICVIYLVWRIMLKYGTEFVDNPRLCTPVYLQRIRKLE